MQWQVEYLEKIAILWFHCAQQGFRSHSSSVLSWSWLVQTTEGFVLSCEHDEMCPSVDKQMEETESSACMGLEVQTGFNGFDIWKKSITTRLPIAFFFHCKQHSKPKHLERD